MLLGRMQVCHERYLVFMQVISYSILWTKLVWVVLVSVQVCVWDSVGIPCSIEYKMTW